MAAVEPLPDGTWLARVNIAFHESLHREAIARTKGRACYWVHRWVQREAATIYACRPRVCTMVEAMGSMIRQS